MTLPMRSSASIIHEREFLHANFKSMPHLDHNIWESACRPTPSNCLKYIQRQAKRRI